MSGRPWGSPPRDACEFAEELMPRLMGTALSLTMHRQDAEDLVQDTLVKVLVKWRQVQAAASPEAYARQVMVNEFLGGKRRKRSGERPVSDEAISFLSGRAALSSPSAVDAVVDHEAMVRWLALLPPRQRAVLVLRFYEDMPDRAIAEVLGCSESSVRVNVHRALQSMRERAGSGASGGWVGED
ncbi:RNA polymerase sigma factor [Actinomycetota bacterium]